MAKTKVAILDESLDNILMSILRVTERLADQAQELQVNEYDLLSLIRGAKELSQTSGHLIEYAPFLAFRDDFEAVDRCREYLLASTEWVGDNRQIILDFLLSYQQALITKTGKATESIQYQLI